MFSSGVWLIFWDGAAVTITDPNDGWRAQPRQRVAVSESRAREWTSPTQQRLSVSGTHDRLSIPETHGRLWISQDKVE